MLENSASLRFTFETEEPDCPATVVDIYSDEECTVLIGASFGGFVSRLTNSRVVGNSSKNFTDPIIQVDATAP